MTRNRLRQIREARGLSQGQVGDKLGVTSQAVSRMETEDSRLNLPRLSQLSRILTCTIGNLVGETSFEMQEEQMPTTHQLDRQRVIAIADALDHYLAQHKLKVIAGGRGELLAEIYDWSVDAGVPIERVNDLSPIRTFLRPRLGDAD